MRIRKHMCILFLYEFMWVQVGFSVKAHVVTVEVLFCKFERWSFIKWKVSRSMFSLLLIRHSWCLLCHLNLSSARDVLLHYVNELRITGKFPGYLSPSAGLKFADVPNGLAAISKVPAAGWGQILAYMAFCEVSQDQSAGTPAAAGDFGFKVLTSSDPAEKTKKLNAELANGRLAMMAIIGMFFQDFSCFGRWRSLFHVDL